MGNDRHPSADAGAMTAQDARPPSSLAVLASRPDRDACDVCCDALPGYVCGDLQIIDVQWLEDHTRRCDYCRQELTTFQRVDHLLEAFASAAAPVTPPPFTQRTRDVARYGRMDSPIGPLLIAVTDDGVCEIDFGRNHSTHDFIRALTARGFDPVHDQQAIAPVVEQLSEYFQGRRNTFDVPVDFSGLTPFTRDVLQATAGVPFGGVATYSEIARRIGNPGASRAVGNALGRNPIPVILPCHRVVPANRTLGKYTGGADIKQTLLSIEGVTLPSRAMVS